MTTTEIVPFIELTEPRFVEACQILTRSTNVLNSPGSWQGIALTTFQHIRESLSFSTLNRNLSPEKIRVYEAWLPTSLIPGDAFFMKPHEFTVGLMRNDLIDNATRLQCINDDIPVDVVPVRIQDGQHRFSAMNALYAKNKYIDFPVLLKINLCQDETAFGEQVKAMNQRLEFTLEDAEKVSTATLVKRAVIGKVIEKAAYRRKRCVNNVLNKLESRLRDPAFVGRQRGRSQTDIEASLKKVVANHRRWWEREVYGVAFSKYNARDKFIQETGLYYMVDETGAWLDTL